MVCKVKCLDSKSSKNQWCPCDQKEQIHRQQRSRWPFDSLGQDDMGGESEFGMNHWNQLNQKNQSWIAGGGLFAGRLEQNSACRCQLARRRVDDPLNLAFMIATVMRRNFPAEV